MTDTRRVPGGTQGKMTWDGGSASQVRTVCDCGVRCPHCTLSHDAQGRGFGAQRFFFYGTAPASTPGTFRSPRPTQETSMVVKLQAHASRPATILDTELGGALRKNGFRGFHVLVPETEEEAVFWKNTELFFFFFFFFCLEGRYWEGEECLACGRLTNE